MQGRDPGAEAADSARTEPIPDASRPFPAALLLAALLAFLLLRVWGLQFGAPPIMMHADERHYAGVAGVMKFSDLNPHRFENPPLFTYVLFAAKQLRRVLTGEEATVAWVRAGGLIMLARWIVAFLGTLTVFVVGAVARRLFGSRAAGIAAAIVVGCSFLHARDSHYGVNDVPMVFLVSVSLWLAVRYLLDGQRSALFLSAVVAGLAAATKYSGAVAAVLPAAALLLRTGPSPRAGLHFAPVARDLAICGALSAGAFLVGNPYAALACREFWSGFDNQLTQWGDQFIWGQSRAPAALLYLEASQGMIGGVHLLAAAGGLLLLLKRDWRTALFLLVFPSLYLAGMFSKALFFWRFALPLLPFLALLAAAAWAFLVNRLAGRAVAAKPKWRVVGAGILLLVPATLEPAVKLLRHDQLLTRQHTWLLARRWIAENLPASARVFFEGFPPRMPAALEAYYPRRHTDKLHEIANQGPDGRRRRVIDAGGWLVTDAFLEEGWQGEAEAAYWADFYARIRDNFELVAEFPPGENGDPRPYVLDALYSPLVDMWSIDRPGWTIRIHRIEPNQWIPIMVADRR